MRTMENGSMSLAARSALARQEEREAEAIQTLSQERMVAAELLQRQIDGETDPARRTAQEKSLETLAPMLEQTAPEIEREKSEAADAKDDPTMPSRPMPKRGATQNRTLRARAGTARHGARGAATRTG